MEVGRKIRGGVGRKIREREKENILIKKKKKKHLIWVEGPHMEIEKPGPLEGHRSRRSFAHKLFM